MVAGDSPTVPMVQSSSARIFQICFVSWIRSSSGTPIAFRYSSIISFIRGGGSLPWVPPEANQSRRAGRCTTCR